MSRIDNAIRLTHRQIRQSPKHAEKDLPPVNISKGTPIRLNMANGELMMQVPGQVTVKANIESIRKNPAIIKELFKAFNKLRFEEKSVTD